MLNLFFHIKMINKAKFEKIKRELEKYDKEREDIILKTREIITLSKRIIYGIHRKENVDKLVAEIKKEIANMKDIAEDPASEYTGSFKQAMQEYVEALAFYHFSKEDRFVDYDDLGVSPEYYLLGLCDLTGELVRDAVNSSINEDYKRTAKIKDFVSELYGMLLQFNFRNGELRKKFDGIKWDLKKLEDMAFDLKMKGKI